MPVASTSGAVAPSLRILYHHRTRGEDAQGIHISEMIQAFRDLGHEVALVALVKSKDERAPARSASAWKWLTGWSPAWLYELLSMGYNLYGYLRLRRAIAARRPDLLYERYSLNTFCGIWASRRFNIPLILEVNAPLYHEQRELGELVFQRLARFSERWICSHSTKTVTVSHVLKEMLRQGGVPDTRLTVIPNGIDPRRFHRGISGEEIRRRYGLDGAVVVGFVGWFRPWHGLELLLQTLERGTLTAPHVRLLLVGDGPAHPALRHYAQTHGLSSRIIFTGPVDRSDVAAHIAAMDIAVQPSVTAYACPMKIIEYMAMGKCVVAPDQPNIREMLQDQINGQLFQPWDLEQLAAALSRVIQEPDRRRELGEKARQTIYERGYLWSANVARVIQLLPTQRPG